MPEFRVIWQQCPHARHDKHVLFVDTDALDNAEVLARDHIERHYGIEWFTIHDITFAPAMPAGTVRSKP